MYDSDTPVTLKEGEDHQTWYDVVNPKQGYNNTRFEKPHLNSVCEKANDNVSVKSGDTLMLSLEYVRMSKIAVYS